MAKKYQQLFTVTSKMAFPLDMLRYDQCFPYSQEDVAQIGASLDRCVDVKERTVTLSRFVDAKTVRNLPTMDRWKSFGWTVQQNNIRFY